MRSVLVKYWTNVFKYELRQVQQVEVHTNTEVRYFIVHTKPARSVSSLLYGFTGIQFVSSKVQNIKL